MHLMFGPLCGFLPRPAWFSGSGGTGRHTILRGWRPKGVGVQIPPSAPYKRFPVLGQNSNGASVRLKWLKMIVLVTIIHIVVCLFLIIVVLLQSGKSADIAAAFGGMGSQTAFGPRGAASALSKATTWSAVMFMVTSITLSIFASRHTGSKSVLQGIPNQTK